MVQAFVDGAMRSKYSFAFLVLINNFPLCNSEREGESASPDTASPFDCLFFFRCEKKGSKLFLLNLSGNWRLTIIFTSNKIFSSSLNKW